MPAPRRFEKWLPLDAYDELIGELPGAMQTRHALLQEV
jgi:hypothetical protein